MIGQVPTRPAFGRVPSSPAGIGLGALGAITRAEAQALWDRVNAPRFRPTEAWFPVMAANYPTAASAEPQVHANCIAIPGSCLGYPGYNDAANAVACARYPQFCIEHPAPAPAPATPPVTNIPVPPAVGSAPPTPLQQCDAPSDVTLSPIDRWVEVDPVQCLWQIVRTATPGNPQVLPNVYGGDASIIIPQSAEPGQTPLSPGAVGLYQPSYQLPAGATGYEISSAAILQAFVDILGRGPTPDELTAAEGQGFANIAELYDYVRGLTVEGTGGFGVVTSDWVPSWVTEHPYLALTGAALGAWWLFGRRRR